MLTWLFIRELALGVGVTASICIISLAAFLAADLMILSTQGTERGWVPPLPVTVCMCIPCKLTSPILTPRNGTLERCLQEAISSEVGWICEES